MDALGKFGEHSLVLSKLLATFHNYLSSLHNCSLTAVHIYDFHTFTVWNNADDGHEKVFFIQLILIANDGHQNPLPH